MTIETLSLQLTTEFKAELKTGDSSSVSSSTRVSSFDSSSVSPLDFESQDCGSEALCVRDMDSMELCDLLIEASDTVLPRQWFCPARMDEDLGPVWVHQLVHETITSLESLQVSKSVRFLDQEKRIQEELESYDCLSSMKDRVYRSISVDKPSTDLALESLPISRSESIRNELHETKQDASVSTLSPIQCFRPAMCDGDGTERDVFTTESLIPHRKLKRSRLNWVRRLFCFRNNSTR